jgi:uncharacterized membrane protein
MFDQFSTTCEMLVARYKQTAVLRSTVGTDKREDWIIDQVDRDIDIIQHWSN